MQKIRLILIVIMLFVSFVRGVKAQDNEGKIILDLKDDSYYEYDDRKLWPNIISKGIDYVDDVKQYNDLLVGDTIEKDFRADIRNKYPDYSDEGVNNWHHFVKKGVKVFRFVEDIKQKIKKWVLDYELPIVVEDDQYEMGGKEEYVESDEVLIKEDFKKVIAYSKSRKDRLAAEEKRARDKNLPRPSQAIKWYRENIAQGNWKDLLKSVWQEPWMKKEKDKQHSKDLSGNKFSMILKNKGASDSGEFEGVVTIKTSKGKVILLNDYHEYDGLSIDFNNSDNVEDISIHFSMPRDLRSKDGKVVLYYLDEAPVYFTGRIKNIKESAILRVNIVANICSGDICEKDTANMELKIENFEDLKKSDYENYINLVSKNIPKEKNRENFEIDDAIWEEYDDNAGYIKLIYSAKNNVTSSVYMIGEEAKYFFAPSISLNNGKIIARFELLDNSFLPLGKNIKFWFVNGGDNQYIADLKIKKASIFDLYKAEVSFGIVLLSIFGGFLLNFMPCVFPVLSLKLLAFTKFGGQRQHNIRRNFIFNSLGIAVAFVCLTVFLVVLKKLDIAMGWGMQFQNVIFLAVMIWAVTYFLACLLGIVNLRFNTNFKLKQKQDGIWFEFLSGLFMVVLSTSCTAPYLGTVIGIALAGDVFDIVVVIMSVGLGLALPYILIATYPKIALSFPRPGKWMKWLNALMKLMLVITLCWLVSILASQTSVGQIWHWIIYIVLALLVWKMGKIYQSEVDKLQDAQIRNILRKRGKKWIYLIVALLIAVSIVDVRWVKYNNEKDIVQSKFFGLDLQEIKKEVSSGKKILVKIGANWCLTCNYNDYWVLNLDFIKDELINNNVEVIDVDWSNYNEQILNLMKRFGRQGVPVYILFSQKFKEGIVLPEILNKYEFLSLIRM